MSRENSGPVARPLARAGQNALGLLRVIGAVTLLPVLSSCGGAGDSGSTASAAWKAGTFSPSSAFAAQCASPRTGTDPTTGKAYPDVKGSATTENNWLRSWTQELYLWYREVADL